MVWQANIAYIAQEHDKHRTVPRISSIRLLDLFHYEGTYPADAARSSCLLAFVKSDITVEKISVKTISTPIHIGFEVISPDSESLNSK